MELYFGMEGAEDNALRQGQRHVSTSLSCQVSAINGKPRSVGSVHLSSMSASLGLGCPPGHLTSERALDSIAGPLRPARPRHGDGRTRPRRRCCRFLLLLFLLVVVVRRRGARVRGPVSRPRRARSTSRQRRPADTAAALGGRARRRTKAAPGVRQRGAGPRRVDQAGRRAPPSGRRVGEPRRSRVGG